MTNEEHREAIRSVCLDVLTADGYPYLQPGQVRNARILNMVPKMWEALMERRLLAPSHQEAFFEAAMNAYMRAMFG